MEEQENNDDELEYFTDDDVPLFDLVKDEDKIESEVLSMPEPPADVPVPLFDIPDETSTDLEELADCVGESPTEEDKPPVFEIEDGLEEGESINSIISDESSVESEDLFELDYSAELSAEEMASPLFAHNDEERSESVSPTLFDVDSERDNPDQLGPLFDHSKFTSSEQGLFDLDRELPAGEYQPLFITEQDRRLSSGSTDLLEASKNNSEDGWMVRKEEEKKRRRMACEFWRLPLYKNVRISLKSCNREFEGILLPQSEPVSMTPSQPLPLRIAQVEFTSKEIASCVRIDL